MFAMRWLGLTWTACLPEPMDHASATDAQQEPNVPSPVTVSVRRGGEPLPNMLVAFNAADGSRGPVVQTNQHGIAGAFVASGSSVSLIDEPDVITVLDIAPGDVVQFHEPSIGSAGQWLMVRTDMLWPQATSHAVSLGCGRRSPILPDTTSAAVFAPDDCPLADTVDLLGFAFDASGHLLATSFAPDVPRDAATLPLGPWQTSLRAYRFESRGTPHPTDAARLTHRVHHAGQWFQTATVPVAEGKQIPIAPIGFAESFEIELRDDRSAQKLVHIVRSTPPPDAQRFDFNQLKPAIDGRFDRATWTTTLDLQEVAQPLALHVRLWIETTEYDEPPGRWDLIGPPDQSKVTPPAVPAVIFEDPNRNFVFGESRLIAGDVTTPRGFRTTMAGRLAPFDITLVPSDASDNFVLTAWTDPDLKR
ncbi:MAG: hypothetical protein AAGA48_17335 [Myxococcota bacterium]